MDDDFLWGGINADDVAGEEGVDHGYGGDQEDRVFGHEENDHLEGNGGDDELWGGRNSGRSRQRHVHRWCWHRRVLRSREHELKGTFAMKRPLVVALLAGALVCLLLTGVAVSVASPSAPSRAGSSAAVPPEDIDLMTTTLMGEELAAAAGIPRTEFDPACAGWVEITDGGEIGYCIPAGITTSPNELYRVSRLLRGHLPTEEQVSSIDELVAGTATSP